MTRFNLLALLTLSACSGGGGANDSFYLRFDQLSVPERAMFSGEFRVALFQDRIFETGRSGTAEATTTGVRELSVSWLTPMGDELFALRQGELVKSTDAQTFEPVTPRSNFAQLGGVDGTLVAMKYKSFGVSELFISKDGGLTWTQLADVDSGFTSGTSESRSISRGADGKLFVSVNVLDDTFGNVDYAGQSYQFTAATNEVKLVSSTKQKLVAPIEPDYRSKEGVAFFTDNNDSVAQQGDATNIKVILNPGVGPDLKTGRRLRWTKPALPFDASASVVVLGQDSEGRLLVSSNGIYRSKTPLKVEDERALVLKGPGCETRHSFTPDLQNDDSVKVSVQNKTGQKVLLRELDNQLRWQRIKELEDGETVALRNNQAKQNVRLMVSDPADETCLGVYVVPMADESTIVANKP
jgi:hypothetical protein